MELHPAVRFLSRIADLGRGGDAVLAHLRKNDVVVPAELQTPQIRAQLARILGRQLARFTVGTKANSFNPKTHLLEFQDTTASTSALAALLSGSGNGTDSPSSFRGAPSVSQAAGGTQPPGSASSDSSSSGTLAGLSSLAGNFASPSNIGSLVGTGLGLATGVPGLGLVGSVAGGAIGSASTTAGQGLSPSLGGALGVGIGNTAIGGALGLGQSQADADLNAATSDIATNGMAATVAATNAAMDANPNAAAGSATNPAPSGIVAGDPEAIAAAASVAGTSGGVSGSGDGVSGGGAAAGGGTSGTAGGEHDSDRPGGDGMGGYARGGRVTGPGGPRDDAVTTRTSAGEFVLNAAAADAIEAVLGKGALERLNAIGNLNEADRAKAHDEAKALLGMMHRRRRAIAQLVPVDHDPFAAAA